MKSNVSRPLIKTLVSELEKNVSSSIGVLTGSRLKNVTVAMEKLKEIDDSITNDRKIYDEETKVVFEKVQKEFNKRRYIKKKLFQFALIWWFLKKK